MLKVVITGLLLALLHTVCALPAWGQTRDLQVAQSVVAPPPTIADLVLLLQSYRPDIERVKALRTQMEKAVPDTPDATTLAVAWHEKALAAEALQDDDARAEFLQRALPFASQAPAASPFQKGSYLRIRNEYASALAGSQGVATALDNYLQFAAELESRPGAVPGLQILTYRHIAEYKVLLGDMDGAQKAIDRLDRIYKAMLAKNSNANALANAAAHIETARGRYLLNMGKLDDAERAFLASLRMREQGLLGGGNAPADRQLRLEDLTQIYLARTRIFQQRLDEAEVLLRDTLKSVLVRDGRNSSASGQALEALAALYLQRGRAAEAVVIAEWADKVLTEAGMARLSPARINAQITLSNALVVAGRFKEAVAQIDALRKNLQGDTRLESGYGRGTLQSIRAYIQVGRTKDALQDSERLLQHYRQKLSESHYDTAEARAYRASALQAAGQLEEARQEYAAALPLLLDPAYAPGNRQLNVARNARLRGILVGYLKLLVGAQGILNEKDMAEAFVLADVARWQSVQQAVTGAALRSAAGTPELAQRIKAVQDADDELQAVYKNLISLRSAPPDKQLPTVISAMESRIALLKETQQRDLKEIRSQFPQYDNLLYPRPASLAAAQKALGPREALLSIYVTPAGSYIWATGPDKKLRFHFSAQTSRWVAEQVQRLRSSVDLGRNSDLSAMPYDLEAAWRLYRTLLAPVQEAWSQADTLLVVANDALGQIPFSMLPTEEVKALPGSVELPFAPYRQVPWLARKVAVAYLPSISNLVTLRALGPAQANRTPFIGFGDPDFGSNTDKAASRSLSHGLRNLLVQHAPVWPETQAVETISGALTQPREPRLSALPDTREEITAIAHALQADPRKDVYLGAEANRNNVFSNDLRRRRVLAFATHGLVTGDLPGLDQPALALSPGAGNPLSAGLLRLDDILKLSLDADLVVLSACNTAAADGNGAEAISGLGRGFFYAGSRSVLATHWPVETVSARQLVTALFEKYARNANLTRAQALRSAMLELIDTQVARDEKGTPLVTYAHPAFWAPYALYGDPGR